MTEWDWQRPTGSEVQRVAFVAHDRVFKKNLMGWKDRSGLVTDNYKDYGINLYGAFGEYYVGKYLNIRWNTCLEDEGGADLVTPGGYKIQVKTTVYQIGGLIHRPIERVVDYHVLVVAQDNPFSFRIAGWMGGDQVVDEKHWDNPIIKNGRPPCHYVKQEDLYDMKILKSKIDEEK